MGKTSMMRRFNSGEFRPLAVGTLAPDLATKRITQNGQDVAGAQVWDTAGAERFRSMPPVYYHNGHVSYRPERQTQRALA